MNTLMLVALAVVAFCYCGGKYCPKVLSGKKEMLLGVLVGMALCSFAGLKLEGFGSMNACLEACPTIKNKCNNFYRGASNCREVVNAAEAAAAAESDGMNWEMEHVDPLPTLPRISGE